jgi:3-hydroxybutyrate dehydrogenase
MDVSVSKGPTPQPFAPGMLRGKASVVTGSTSGIGLGIAQAFAAQGADVLLNGFGNPEEIESVRGSLAGAHGVRVSYSAADISKPDEIDGMVAQATGGLGGVDILVNNAGIQHTAPVREFPSERWDAIIAINLKLLGEKQSSLEFATPDQIGALAAFLCSDVVAQIRGAALPVDSGWTAQ